MLIKKIKLKNAIIRNKNEKFIIEYERWILILELEKINEIKRYIWTTLNTTNKKDINVISKISSN
jgi:hypothetical protein